MQSVTAYILSFKSEQTWFLRLGCFMSVSEMFSHFVFWQEEFSAFWAGWHLFVFTESMSWFCGFKILYFSWPLQSIVNRLKAWFIFLTNAPKAYASAGRFCPLICDWYPKLCGKILFWYRYMSISQNGLPHKRTILCPSVHRWIFCLLMV